MFHKKSLTFLFFIISFSSFSAVAHANTPTVTSFNISPSYIDNAHSVLLSWATDSASGSELLYPCMNGISVQDANGANIACGTRQTAGSGTSGQMSFTVINVAGATQQIPVTIYPKDSNGTDYDAGAKTAITSIGTATQPITNFSLSSTSVTSGSSVTLSWQGQYVIGVNMNYSCNDNVSVYAKGSNTKLICNTPMVTTGGLVLEPLPTGSAAYTVINSSNTDAAHITFNVFPAIHTGLYDMTHALSAPLTVASKPVALPPSVDYFSNLATTSNPAFGVPFSLGWSIKNAAGANLQFTCDPDLMYQVGATTLPCNTPAFTAAMSASSTVPIVITSRTGMPASPSVTLLPQVADGTYNGMVAARMLLPMVAKSSVAQASAPVISTIVATSTVTPHQPPLTPALSLERRGGGVSPLEGAAQNTAGTSTTPASTTSAVLATSTKTSAVKTPIARLTIPLFRGSNGVQVRALQTFLSWDPSVYPEGTINGNFGPATDAAVKRFQLKYNLTTADNPAYGFVGPATRAVINAMSSF